MISFRKRIDPILLKFIIFPTLIFLLACFTIISFSISSKREIALLLSDTMRNDLILLRYRNAMNVLQVAAGNSFYAVQYRPFGSKDAIHLFDRDNQKINALTNSLKVNLFSDHEQTSVIGEVIFFFDLNFLIISLFIAFIVVSSITYYIFSRFKKALVLKIEREFVIKEALYFSQLATQVAHDIRSPLATIDMITSGTEGVENNFELLKSAAKRIHGIADDLLDRNRVSAEETHPLKKINLSSTLQSIVDEKKIHIVHHELVLELYSKDVLIKANEVELFRIISNLINNSIEASEKSKTITIGLKKESDHAVIQIADKGKGIPKELLEKLGERGVTQGKEKGNGLGIFHAKKTIESWGGELQVISAVGEGTTISLILPIVCSEKKHIVLLDDDDLLRLTWESKARTENIDITTFSHPDDLLKAISKLPENAVYYIDSCLSDEIKGEDVALQLSKLGISDIYLATGFEADKFGDLDHIKGIVGKDFPEG